MRSLPSGGFTNLREWLHQLWNRLHVLQSLWDRVAGSSDPTEGLADVEEIPHWSTGSGNGVPAGYRELMRLEIADLFDLAVEACVDDVPDPCCGVRPPLLCNFFINPPDEPRRFNRCVEPSGIEALLLRDLVKLLFQV